ncbi:hypothetical protein ACUSIJ_25000 [Pseudochelatococcus sp. B33]
MSIRPGEVEITLGGKIVTLRPSLQAARTLNRRYGNFNALIAAIANQDLEASLATIVVGAGAEGKEVRALEDAAWSEGTINIAGDLIKYVSSLSNGGRPVSDDDRREDGGADPNGA